MQIYGSKVAMLHGRQGPKCGRCGRKGEAMMGVKEKAEKNDNATGGKR